MPTLPYTFYDRSDVVQIARDLLGMVLISRTENLLTSGIITETEAYAGRNDRACHAHGGRRTARNEVMYGEPGRAYIYLCYGIHHLFNVVTHHSGMADAVLIRALWPLEGVEQMKMRRGVLQMNQLCNGPGKLTQALGISTQLNGVSLLEGTLSIENRGFKVNDQGVIQTTRIGIDYAGEDAKLPWRFFIPDPEKTITHPDD